MARIGPVLPSGKFYMNYSGKKKTAAHKKQQMTAVSKSLTKKQKKAVKQIIKKEVETKYYSEQLLDKCPLDWGIHTYYDPSNGVNLADILPLVPRVTVGDNNNQRNGKKIKPTTCYVDIMATLNEPLYGGTAPADTTQTWTKDIFVVIYVLRAKEMKNFEQLALTKADTIGNLLDNGDNTSKYFGDVQNVGGVNIIYTKYQDLQKPINKEYFTLLNKRVVRLTKNVGKSYNDAVGPDPNTCRGSWMGRIKFKLPTLVYDDQPTNTQYNGGYPTNSCVLLAMGAVLANGQDSVSYNPDNSIAGVLPNPFNVSVRSHYYYKDA